MATERADDSMPADPDGKAAELLEEGAAAPRRGRRGGARAGAGRKKSAAPRAAASGEESAVDPGPITEAEIEAMSGLFGTLWTLALVKGMNFEELDPNERRALGNAAVPVFRKYAGLLGGFEAEFTLIIVVGGLVVAKMPRSEEEPTRNRNGSGAVVVS